MKTVERRRPKPDAEKSLQAFAASSGRALEEPVRRDIEGQLGHDFSQVRVFDDPRAAEMTEALGAEAVAVGQSLFFASGRYRPTTPEGRELLLHELAHTAQQKAATRSVELRPASPAAEGAADAPEPQPKLPVALARRSAGPNLDPATLVQSLARLVARNLRRDPNDARGDVRRQLERLTPEFRESLVERLDRDLTDAEMARVRALLGEAPPEGETAPRDASAPTDEEAQAQTAPQGAVTSDTPETTPTDTSETDGFFGSLVRGVLSAFGAETETNPAIEGGAKAGSVVGGETAVAGGASSGAATVAAEEAAAGGATELSAMTEGGNADPAALDRIENAVSTPEETGSSQTDEVPEAEGPAAEAQAAPPLSTRIPERVEPSSSAPALPTMADLSVEGAEVVPEWAEEPEPIVSERTGSPAGDDLAPAPVAEFDAPETAETEAVGGDVAPTGEAVSEPVRPLPSEESQPEAADAGGGGTCGGGGGGEAPANAEPEPAASATGGGDDPDAVFAGAASGTPTQIGAAIGPAREAACASAAALREEVLANAPTIPRPTGAPDGAQPAPRDPGATPIPPTVARTDLTPLATTEAPGPEGPTGAGPTIAAPRVAGTAQGQLSEADAVGMAAAVESLPVSDPGLAVSAELPATMEATGATDPAQVEAQRTAAATAQTQAHTDARNDAARPRGEQDIFPSVPMESLSGRPCLGAAPVANQSAPVAGVDAGVAALAESEQGDAVRIRVAASRGEIASARAEGQAAQLRERERTDREVQAAVQQNSEEQAQARQRAQEDVRGHREAWTREQDAVAQAADQAGTTAAHTAEREVRDRRIEANQEAQGHVQEGNRRIGEARSGAEREAGAQRAEARRQSSGFFGWLADRFRAFFEGIRNAIQRAFQAARDAVRAALTYVRDRALAAIEAARRWAVDRILVLADAILAAADVLLAAFPALRERFNALIEAVVEAATALVNRLADALRAGVVAILDALMCALDAVLGLLLRGLLAAVEAVAATVQSAIQAAQSLAQGFGAFAELIAAIARNPRGWVRNLAASAAAGIRDCLWSAFRAAIRQWFNTKVEEVVGVGRAIWNLLVRGGISLARLGRMAWQGIQAAIPAALISLAIEKIVSLLVPVVGGLVVVIQGVIAAYGAIGRVLAALQKVFAYLRSVAGGGSPGLFAEAVAASAVAVIDFLANWLIARLARGAGQRVGAAFRNLATRVGALVRRGATAVRRGASAVGRVLRRGAAAVGGGLRRAGRFVANSRFGRFVQRQRDRFRHGRERHAAPRNPQLRLDTAVARIQPSAEGLLQRAVGEPRFRLMMAYWRLRHRLTSLTLEKQGESTYLKAVVNPFQTFARGYQPSASHLAILIRQVADAILNRPDVWDRSERLRHRRAADPTSEIEVGAGGIPALTRSLRSRTELGQTLRGGRFRSERFRFGPGRASASVLGHSNLFVRRSPSGLPILPRRSSQAAHTAAVRLPGGSYAEWIPRLRALGTDRDVARAILSVVAHGRPTFAMRRHASVLSEFVTVFFVVESLRNRANVVLAPILVGSVASGARNWDQVLIGTAASPVLPASLGNVGAAPVPVGRGIPADSPMAPRGAPRAARDLGRQLGYQEGDIFTGDEAAPHDAQTDPNRLRDQEARVVTRWLEAESRVTRTLFKNRDQVYDHMYRKMLQYYGLRG